MTAHTPQEFEDFMSQLKETNQHLNFFCDFDKINQNVENIKLSLHMLNSLIFERMGYVLIHTNGDNPHLFRVAKKGFQIWTAEHLREIGFSAEHAPYYAVVRFDTSKEIDFERVPLLKKRAQTTVAEIKAISEFVSIK